MATSRPFSYNTGALIPGTTQSGNIAQALIYDVAISDAEVLSNFDSTKSRFGY